MVGHRFLRWAAGALVAYGVLGVVIAAAILVVGVRTFSQVASLQATLETQRTALVQSMRTVSATLQDTAGATAGFQQSLGQARGAADQASILANSSAGTFRDLAAQMASVTVLGFQPLATLGPRFDNSADQLQQLAIQLGATRDALAQNGSDVQRVGGDLGELQTQLDALAGSLAQPGVLGLDTRSLLPLQIAFYGLCLLAVLQSGFAIVAGIVLYRLTRALGADLKTATTSDASERDPVRAS